MSTIPTRSSVARPFWLIALLALCLAARSARAAGEFDMIYADSLIISGWDPGLVSFMAGDGFALIVNTAASALPADVLAGATFDVTSSRDSFSLSISAGALDQYGPIGPGVAVGNIGGSNIALLGLLTYPETLVNTIPALVLYATAGRMLGTPLWVTVPFDIVMHLGGREVRMHTAVEYRGGGIGVLYPTAKRVSSTVTTPVVSTTWGRVKALYR